MFSVLIYPEPGIENMGLLDMYLTYNCRPFMLFLFLNQNIFQKGWYLTQKTWIPKFQTASKDTLHSRVIKTLCASLTGTFAEMDKVISVEEILSQWSHLIVIAQWRYVTLWRKFCQVCCLVEQSWGPVVNVSHWNLSLILEEASNFFTASISAKLFTMKSSFFTSFLTDNFLIFRRSFEDFDNCLTPLLQTCPSFHVKLHSHWRNLYDTMRCACSDDDGKNGFCPTNACGYMICKYVDRKGLAAMLISVQSAGVAPEVNLRITQARKYAWDLPWFWNSGQTSPEIQK